MSDKQQPGPVEAAVNAFADAMTMVGRDILAATETVAKAVQAALAPADGAAEKIERKMHHD